ncbi:MAG TPA: Rho termination factor N-terminal domain-containing protein, partial [Galbitalea sp.]|nr:Rho termination factor N-terminal domain-containing protein [Galbitalea sp.]
MTEVNIGASSTDSRAKLSALRLPELVALANARGIVGAAKLRKGELVDAISADNDENNPNTDAPEQVIEPATTEQAIEPAATPSAIEAPRKRASRRATTADAEAIAARADEAADSTAPVSASAHVAEHEPTIDAATLESDSGERLVPA